MRYPRRIGQTIDIDRERSQADTAAAFAPTPLDYGGFGMGVLGTALGAYGTYQASQQAEREHRDAMQAYREDQEMEKQRMAREEEQRQLGNTMGFANYARELENDVYGTYTPYSRSIGR